MAEIKIDILIDGQPLDTFINQLSDVNDRLKEVEKTTKGMSVKKSLDDVAKSAGNVNKEVNGVSKGMKLLNGAKSVLSTLGKGFKSLTNVTKTFGTVLKANPLFMLLAIVQPIINIFKKFGEELVIIQLYMNALGKVIEFISKAINKLTNALLKMFGIDNEGTNEQIENYKKLRAEREKTFNDAQLQAEHQINMMKAQGVAVDDIREAELLLQNQRVEFAYIELKKNKAQVEFLQSQEFSTDKQKEELQSLIEETGQLEVAYQSAANGLQVLAATTQTARNNDVKSEKEKNIQIAEERRKAEKKRIEDEHNSLIEFEKLRTSTNRLIEDNQISMIEDQTERELEQNRVKYERLRADAIANDKLTFDEREALLEQYRLLQDQKNDEINNVKIEKEKENRLKLEEELRQLDLELVQDENERKLIEIEDEYNTQLDKLKELNEQGIISDQQFADRSVQLEQIASKKRMDVAEEEAESKKQLQNDITKASLSASSQLLNGIMDNLEEGSEAYKAIAITQTTISTIQSAIDAFKSMAGIPYVGPILGGIAAAAAAASGAAAIAKIKQQKPNARGGGSSGSSNVSVASPSTSTPNINMFGGGNQTGGDSSQFGSAEPNENPEPIKAVVSWNDIDATSKNDNKMKQQMSL